jgi:DNA-binding CsgD family transcriptional regulator/PAS domain-containing protein
MTTIDDFSRIVRTIYDAAVEPADWTVASGEILAAVSGNAGGLGTTDRERNQIVGSVGIDSAMMLAYDAYYGRLDPMSSALVGIPAGAIATRQQVMPLDIWARSEFCNDWARPNDYGDFFGSLLTRDDGSAWWLNASAPVGPDPFGTPERVSLLRTLVPHLQQAIRTQIRLYDLDRRNRDLVAAVDSFSDGVAIVGGGGRLIHLNPAAEAIVASRDGLRLRSGHLTATSAHGNARLDGAVHQALSGERSDVPTGGCVAVSRLSGKRPYVIRVIPLAPEVAVGVASPTALVLIVDPEKEPEPELEALRRLYGLTDTEAEVALRVLDGSGLGPIADELSVSLSTVRTHLQHVFDKTQTHRQAELVRLLLGGLAATRSPGTICGDWERR